RNQVFVILVLRLDGNYLAAVADPFGKAEREEADVGADVDDQGSVRHEFPELINRARFKILLVDGVERQKDPMEAGQPVHTGFRRDGEQLDDGVFYEALKHLGRIRYRPARLMLARRAACAKLSRCRCRGTRQSRVPGS